MRRSASTSSRNTRSCAPIAALSWRVRLRVKPPGADLITVLTLTGTGEAVGIVSAARAAGIPAAVSFTVEQDGRLPDGTPLSAAIAEVDAEGGPDYFMINCAHPSHIAPGLADSGD
jgi:homocysteine S-methyltransferase